MKTIKILLILSMFGMLITSCENDENINQSSIYPLNVGNSWTYKEITYHKGTPYISSSSMELKYNYTIDGENGFTIIPYTKGTPFALLQNDKEGNLVLCLFDADTLITKSIWFKKNAKKNDKWIFQDMYFINEENSKCFIEEKEVSCIVTDTLINTPKGKFICKGYKYHPGGFDQNNNPAHTFIYYLSENIGIVKFLHYEHDFSKSYLFKERLLIDYSIK